MLDRCTSLVVVALVVAAIAPIGKARAQDEQRRPAPSFPQIPPDAAAGTMVMMPCMEELEGSVRCGRYRVWENRETRQGRTLDLGFVVADALDPNSKESDAITWFFGGPGSAVTEAAPFLIERFAAMRRQRDLLLLDFRGVGASGPLDCGVPYPRGTASRFGEIFPIDHIEDCRDELSKRAELDLYTSAHNMDDLDDLRARLNYTALNLNGGSYGTLEIQVFLRRHPESVRTAVMNAVAPIFEPVYASHARGLQNALDELVAECLEDPACGSAYPALESTTRSVLDRVRKDPPRIEVEGRSMRFGIGELAYALRGLLYGRGGEVPAFLARANRGEWQGLADYYLQRSGWVSSPTGEAGMHFSVICAEDIERTTAEDIERETAGTFLGDYLIGGYKRVCDVWPNARLEESFWQPVASAAPVLLLSGSRDPVTPPKGAEQVARHLSNHLHVVVPGGGHGVDGPCLIEIQTRFVETGTVDDLDLSCLEKRPGTAFALPGRDG